MGQVIQPQAGGGSGGSASSSSLVVKTGRFAINTNDVVILTIQGIAYAAQTTSYAASTVAQSGQGNAVNSLSTLTSGAFTPANDVKQAIYVDPATLNSFVAYPTLASNAGLRLNRIGPDNVSLANIILDNAAAATVGGINIVPLSNGNLAVVWGTLNTGQYFAIVTKELVVVVAKTSFGVAQTTGPFIYATALSGGGFAIAYSGTVGNAALLAIYSNTGAVTLAPTTIAGSPTGDARAKIQQLSNGNLVVGIASTTAAQAITRAIFTAAGGVVAAIAVLDAGTKATITTPDVSVIAGFFAITANVIGNIKAYVQSNAGVTQGTAFSDAAGTVTASARIVNDGTSFWLYYCKITTTTAGIAFLPSTGGAGALLYTALDDVGDAPDAVYDRDFLVCGSVAGVIIMSVTQAGVASTYAIFGTTGVTASAPSTIKVIGDFVFSKFITANPHVIAQFRYISMSLTGVARSSVAAGNPNTLLSVNVGPASTLVNTLPGQPSKSFVFTTAAVVGNNGVLLNNSISMKGI